MQIQTVGYSRRVDHTRDDRTYSSIVLVRASLQLIQRTRPIRSNTTVRRVKHIERPVKHRSCGRNGET